MTTEQKPLRVLLDSQIYDKLAEDDVLCKLINQLIENKKIKIIAPRSVWEELWKAPKFKGIPKLFPVEATGNTVGRIGIMRVGDAIGRGEIFQEHLGNSKKHLNDALIADAASYCNWFVSDDRRSHYRMTQAKGHSCSVFNYEMFRKQLSSLLSEQI